jgi:argininosuccinate lyase
VALWDGRFSAGPAQDMVAFGECLDVDMQMWREDLTGSRAHVEVLLDAGLIDTEGRDRILEGLRLVEAELAEGSYVPGPELEDVHMAVEARLIHHIGEAIGGKLHTARSRNDQVATDVRLWLRARLEHLESALVGLVSALSGRAESDGQVLMPGFTHLQRGQPILLGHHLLAHAWSFQRDAGRVRDALRRLDACPLGAGALAGTPHPIDRHLSARLLGFSGPVENAMDAVAARDHELEALSACAIAMTHLSRLSEEVVLWSTAEFSFARVGEGYATGSSIMPQKRNPDAAELIRGKSGRVIGSLMACFTLVKGLPMAYNRDLQEDRAALFDAVATTLASVQIATGMVKTLAFNKDRYEEALEGDFLLATELADHLATRGVPFRQAHHVVGRLVADLEARGENFSAVDLPMLRTFHEAFGEDALEALNPRHAAERRVSYGGTSSSEIARQVQGLQRWASEHNLSTGERG